MSQETKLLRQLVEKDISKNGRVFTTMVRAGLLIDILDELDEYRSRTAPRAPEAGEVEDLMKELQDAVAEGAMVILDDQQISALLSRINSIN